MKPVEQYKEKRKEAKTTYSLYKYYFIIAVLSLIAVFVLPMLGSDPTLGLDLPTTVVGWIIYVITKICVAAINMLLFHCFMRQGKLNIKDNPYYIEACEILRRYGMGPDANDPRSPEVWESGEYKHKGITITITTILSAICLTQAILIFDWVSMLIYLLTIVMGLIFGLFQQDNAETYWTDEFWHYAKMIEKQMTEKEATNDNNQSDTIPQS